MQHSSEKWKGPCSNIKAVFTGMGISIIKIRQSWDCLIFIMGNLILIRLSLYWNGSQNTAFMLTKIKHCISLQTPWNFFLLANKRGVGPVKLLCITMFDMSKIRAKSWSSKSPKVFMVSVTILGNFYCISWEYSQNKKEISRIHSYSIVVSWVEILLDLKLDYSMQTTPIPWQLMHWLLVSPGHQLSWYWLCKIGQTFSQLPRIRIWTICVISVLRNDMKCKCSFMLLKINSPWQELTLTYISVGKCKKDVTPLLTHWSYIFLALTHQYYCQACVCLWLTLVTLWRMLTLWRRWPRQDCCVYTPTWSGSRRWLQTRTTYGRDLWIPSMIESSSGRELFFFGYWYIRNQSLGLGIGGRKKHSL